MAKSVSLEARLFRRSVVNEETGCIEWIGAASAGGYGRIQVAGKSEFTHRVSYALFVGELKDNMHIDHLCRNRICFRPDHLEQVTPGVNAMRGLAGKVRGAQQRAKTHCPRNHPYDKENTIWDKRGYRLCMICHKVQQSEYRKRRKERRAAINAL